MRTTFLFSAAVLTLMSASAFAQDVRQVTLLGFYNLGSSDADYLAGSLTDATRQKLKSEYVFNELPKDKWEDVADENKIYREDLHTKTAALQLGILCRQDFILTGSYSTAKKGNKTVLATEVLVFDVRRQKLIDTLTFETAADSGLFKSVDDVAALISNRFAELLPGRQGGGKTFLDPFRKQNFIELSGGLLVHSGSENITIKNGAAPSVSDYAALYGGTAGYYLQDIAVQDLGLSLSVGLYLGSTDFDAALNSDKLASTVSVLQPSAGVFYMWQFNEQFTLRPELSAGVGFISVELDYSSLRNQATSTSGQTVSSRTLDSRYFSLAWGASLLYFFDTFYARFGLAHSMAFYDGESAQGIATKLGAGVRF